MDGLGYYLEQKLEGAECTDRGRTARFASLGLLFGPWEHYWYRILDSRLPGKATRVVACKVLLDQFLMSPAEYAVFYVGEFMSDFVFLELHTHCKMILNKLLYIHDSSIVN